MTDKSLTFCIEYPPKAAQKYGLNAYYAGKHWTVRRKDAELWHLITRSALRRYAPDASMYQCPVEITFRWNDRLDIDNHAAMGKMIVDALRGRVIADDSRRFLSGVHHTFHDEQYIEITVTPVPETAEGEKTTKRRSKTNGKSRYR